MAHIQLVQDTSTGGPLNAHSALWGVGWEWYYSGQVRPCECSWEWSGQSRVGLTYEAGYRNQAQDQRSEEHRMREGFLTGGHRLLLSVARRPRTPFK
jgi:hypothetical protein